MGKLEEALSAFEAKVSEAEKAAAVHAKHLKRIVLAARAGQVTDLERSLAALKERADAVAATSAALLVGWSFDTSEHLAAEYASELQAAAETAGLRMFQRDGRIYAFPLLLLIDARERGVRVGRRIERRIRPKELVRLLAALQKRPQRFREQQFLQLLYQVYQRLAGLDWRNTALGGMGPVFALSDVHETLTLLPGADYPVEEFGRDILLLDRQPDLRTRDGAAVRFPGSAMARERNARPIKVYDEEGREQMYFGLAFIKGG